MAMLKREHAWQYVMAVTLATGIALRLTLLFLQRDLWVDECMLVLGVIWQPLPMLYEPLPYLQQAGVGYVWLLKGMSVLFGNSELSFRAMSMLASIAALPLFAWLLRRGALHRGIAALILLMAAINPLLLQYAGDAKQYSLDGLLALIMLTVFRSPLRERLVVMLPLLVFGVLASHPFVFVAAAFCVAWAMELRRVLHARLLLCAAVTAGVFLAHYFLFIDRGLDTVLHNDFMLWYHNVGFAPVAFWEAETWSWYFGKVSSLFNSMMGFRWMIFGLLPVVFGVAELMRRKEWSFLVLLLLPLLFAMAASALHLYSVRDRLLLFTLPSLLLLLGYGIEYLRASLNRRSAAFVLLAFFVAVGVIYPVYGLAQRFARYGDLGTKEEIGAAFRYVQEHRREGEALHVAWNVYPNISYYCERDGVPYPAPVAPGVFPPNPTGVREFAVQIAADVGARGWAIISHHRIHGLHVLDTLRGMGYSISGFTSEPDGSAGAYLLRKEEGAQK